MGDTLHRGRQREKIDKNVQCVSSTSSSFFSRCLHTGKGAVAGDAEVAVGARVVLSLTSPILDLGCCVAVDNYYNSPELALIERKTDAYGTAQPGRKNMPNFSTKQLQKGQMDAYREGKCLSLQWKDKVITFLSTVHSSGMADREAG